MTTAIHHIEIWTNDLLNAEAEFDWILTQLGWAREAVDDWDIGRIWRAASGEYIVVEQSPDIGGALDRMCAGVNHLALGAETRSQVDELRSSCARHGWTEMFPEKYPHAGGSDSYALYVTNTEGFELEIVAK